MIVVDASALVDLLLDQTGRSDWVAEHVASDGDLHAPHLIDVEVVSAARRLVHYRRIGAKSGAFALLDLAALSLTRYPHSGLLDRMWRLRDSLTASDAAYVALAEALDVPLITTDERLARAHGHRARVLSPEAA